MDWYDDDNDLHHEEETYNDDNHNEGEPTHEEESSGYDFLFGNDDDHDLQIDSHNHIGSMVGNPEEWGHYYSAQINEDTCAIVAQQGILKTFGIDISETDLKNYAENHGIYEPGNGTTMGDIGELMSDFGVENERFVNGSIDDLISELEKGNRIIAGVDSNEIWTPGHSLNPFNNFLAELPDAGHAVWITGIDKEKGVVILNDPGSAHGQAMEVSISDFSNAWEDFDNFYCVTRG